MALSLTVASARWGVAQAPHAADSVTIRIVGDRAAIGRADHAAIPRSSRDLRRRVARSAGDAGDAAPRAARRRRALSARLARRAGLRAGERHRVGHVSRPAQGASPAPRATTAPTLPTAGFAPTTRPQATTELFVIALKHARAADVASNVNTLFGRGTFGQIQNASQSRTLAEELRANQVPPLDAGALATPTPGASPAAPPRSRATSPSFPTRAPTACSFAPTAPTSSSSRRSSIRSTSGRPRRSSKC